jgi:hypothetical protein
MSLGTQGVLTCASFRFPPAVPAGDPSIAPRSACCASISSFVSDAAIQPAAKRTRRLTGILPALGRMRREPAFSSLDFESPRASDQRYGDSRQSGMLWPAQFRHIPVSTASGSLSVHQGSSICSLQPNWIRSISSASG